MDKQQVARKLQQDLLKLKQTINQTEDSLEGCIDKLSTISEFIGKLTQMLEMVEENTITQEKYKAQIKEYETLRENIKDNIVKTAKNTK